MRPKPIAESYVVMTVLEVPIAAASRAMELGRRHGVKTILNPAPRGPASGDLRFRRLFTPNESELRILLGLPAHDPSSSRELAASCAAGRPERNCHLGRSGALILADDLDMMVPAVAVDVVDTTGAAMRSIPGSRSRSRKGGASWTP